MVTFTITNKHRPKATILMLISLYGKQYRKSIGIGMPVKYWNDKKKRARTTADFDGNSINEQIDAWEEIGKKVVKHFTDQKYAPTQEEFAKIIADTEMTTSEDKEDTSQSLFCGYFERVYIPRYLPVRNAGTVKRYFTALHKLKEYEETTGCKLKFEDINIDFYNTFQAWFYARGFSANYFGSIIKTVKQVYREAREYDNLHSYNGIEHRDFITIKETADSIYLDTDELDKIYRIKLSPDSVQNAEGSLSDDNIKKKIAALERARGLFLIGCYTGLRVSDFSRLKEAHIGKYITIKTTKTGTNVIIPIHPVVREIIDSGFDLENTISDQKLNEQIKELCRIAGITRTVLINKNNGGRNEEILIEKYKLVSSHTARRSFATNAYKAGVPTIAIMKITGHTKESTFLKYIKVSAQENAEILSRHPFFMEAKKQDDCSCHPVD